jgi:hypothetical protein
MAKNLLLSPDLIIGKHVFVQSTAISDDLGHVFTNVPEIREGSSMRTILGDNRGGELDCVVNLARRKRWERPLVPQADVNDSVGQVNLLDVVDDDFFLRGS